MQQTALSLCLLFILWLLARDVKRRAGLSSAFWIVFVWVVIIGSRSVSSWFEFGRVVGDQAADYDEGNPFERNVRFALILMGVITLFRRGVRLSDFLRQNLWLTLFFGYCLVSTLWADLMFVSFKRWVKDTGNVVMVLVLLSEAAPVAAVKAIFVRSACLLVPLSVLFIRYFGDLGRAYHPPTGEMMYTGVATHKNTLGVLVMVSILALTWDLLSRWPPRGAPGRWVRLAPELVLLGTAWWLLVMCRSATSLACTIVGLAILLTLRLPTIRPKVANIEIYAVGFGVLFWLLDSGLGLTRFVVQDLLGRDMTLTTRTDVWPLLLKHAANPIVGAGFMSFWSGERLSFLYEKLSIIQAHNGYLELYLNLGLVGVGLFFALFFSALQRIKRDLLRGSDFAIVQLMFLVVTVIHNFTEASISCSGLLWFSFLLMISQYARPEELPSADEIREPANTTLADSASSNNHMAVSLNAHG